MHASMHFLIHILLFLFFFLHALGLGRRYRRACPGRRWQKSDRHGSPHAQSKSEMDAVAINDTAGVLFQEMLVEMGVQYEETIISFMLFVYTCWSISYFYVLLLFLVPPLKIAYVVDFGKSVCFIAKHKTNRRADEVLFKCHGFEVDSVDKVWRVWISICICLFLSLYLSLSLSFSSALSVSSICYLFSFYSIILCFWSLSFSCNYYIGLCTFLFVDLKIPLTDKNARKYFYIYVHNIYHAILQVCVTHVFIWI